MNHLAISCGDYLEAEYSIENGVIKNLHFNGNGCAYFVSSSNLLCKYLSDKSIYWITLFYRLIWKKY
nr:iron-sulfur cluster assembly scaffold protein [Mycoplasmopsis bovis]